MLGGFPLQRGVGGRAYQYKPYGGFGGGAGAYGNSGGGGGDAGGYSEGGSGKAISHSCGEGEGRTMLASTNITTVVTIPLAWKGRYHIS